MVNAAIIGGGPAGLMAAEMLSAAGVHVDVYDAMPSVGRKFLMAGRGGLNLTHAEPPAQFLTRFGARNDILRAFLESFGAQQMRAWASDLGIETFVGTSRRVFPTEMKAAPLLRAWLRRLRASGVVFHVRHKWMGWDGGALRFDTPAGPVTARADATVLALGGGSWPSLGSDGAWVGVLRDEGVAVADLKPANCGFDVSWSEHFSTRFAGAPVKHVSASVADQGRRQGEFVVTATGVEGGLIYVFSSQLRDTFSSSGQAILTLDLQPKKTQAELLAALAAPRNKTSMATYLRKRAGIEGVKAALLREMAPDALQSPQLLAEAIKALPLRLNAPRPLDEAISSAGGIRFEDLTPDLMVCAKPGLFCAGEMLDWEAPTGGYLLTASMATGRTAGAAAAAWLKRNISS